MATIKRFEDIEAWQKARDLTRDIYSITKHGEFSQDYGLKEQIRRAAVSVMSNIAEGFERDGNSEFKQQLSIAKGSAGEIRSQLYVALDVGYISNEQFCYLSNLAEDSISLIRGFMRYLEATEIKGQKFR